MPATRLGDGVPAIVVDSPMQAQSKVLQELDTVKNMVLDESTARIQSVGSDSWSRHVRDWVLGTNEGKALIFLIAFLVLLSSGTACWAALGDAAGTESVAGTTVWESMWISWGLFFDPGTQTGVPADAEFAVKFVALTFSVLGFIWNLTVLGIVVEAVRSFFDYSTKVCGRIVENHHTLILGWGNRTMHLLSELVAAYEEDRNKVEGTCCKRRKTIVILASKPRLDVMQDISMHFAQQGLVAASTLGTIKYREGDPADWKELQKVSASAADDILILGEEGAQSGCDTPVVQRLLALTALPRDARVSGEVFVELANAENMGLAQAMLKQRGVGGAVQQQVSGVVLRETMLRLLCLQCWSPEVGEALQEMVSFRSNHVYLVPVPERLRDTSFLDASKSFPNATLLAVKQSSSRNSGECKNDRTLVFIASRDPTPSMDGQAIAKAVSTAPPRARASRQPGLQRHGTVAHVANRVHEGHKVAIVVGSPPDLQYIISVLQSVAGNGLEMVHVLAREQPNKHQQDNEKIKWYIGDSTSPHALKKLELPKACTVLVLADRLDADETAAATDARSLSTVFQLRGLMREMDDIPIVCELLSTNSKQIVEENELFREKAYYFHSVRLETALFATAADDTKAFNTIMALVEPNGQDLFAERVETLETLLGEDLTGEHDFWTLREKLFSATSERCVLIGWKRLTNEKDVFPKWDINPDDKKEALSFAKEDLLLYLKSRSSLPGDATTQGVASAQLLEIPETL